MMKLTTDGEMEWQRTIGGSLGDALNTFCNTSDGGYLIGGNSASNISGEKSEDSRGGTDYWIIKLDAAAGDIEWQKTIGGDRSDALYSIIQTADGGYFGGGSSSSNISGEKTESARGPQLLQDYWVVKLDALGEIEWQKTIGGDGTDNLFTVKQTPDGGYILGGQSASGISYEKSEEARGAFDYWIVKLNAFGAIEWQRTIGGDDDDLFHDIVLTEDGGFLIGGDSISGISGDKTEDSKGMFDFWIIKLSGEGHIEWQKTIGGSESEFLYSIANSEGGNFLLAGSSHSPISGDKSEDSRGNADVWVNKINGEGGIIWQKTIGGSEADTAKIVRQASDGSIIFAANSLSSISGEKSENCRGESDFWVVKLAFETAGTKITTGSFAKIFPNPFTDKTYISFEGSISGTYKIYDITGKVVKESAFGQTFLLPIVFPGQAGLYFIEISAGNQSGTFKIIKL